MHPNTNRLEVNPNIRVVNRKQRKRSLSLRRKQNRFLPASSLSRIIRNAHRMSASSTQLLAPNANSNFKMFPVRLTPEYSASSSDNLPPFFKLQLKTGLILVVAVGSDLKIGRCGIHTYLSNSCGETKIYSIIPPSFCWWNTFKYSLYIFLLIKFATTRSKTRKEVAWLEGTLANLSWCHVIASVP